MEMHMVHANVKYTDVGKMRKDDGLAVLGFMFEIDEDEVSKCSRNPLINMLLLPLY